MTDLLDLLPNILRAVPPETLLPLIPKTGNPLVDAGVKLAATALLHRQSETVGEVDPKTGTTPEEFWHRLITAPCGLFFISGPRGSGKSALAYRIAQDMQRETFILNAPIHLPWVQPLNPKHLDDVPEGCVVIVDDAGQVASSRDYNSKIGQAAIKVAIEARHEDLVVIANTTISSLVNKYLLDADAVFFKRPSDMSEFVERQGMQRILRVVEREYEQLDMSPEAEAGWVYARSTKFRYRGMLHYNLPEGYSAHYSKNKARHRSLSNGAGLTVDGKTGQVLESDGDQDGDDED